MKNILLQGILKALQYYLIYINLSFIHPAWAPTTTVSTTNVAAMTSTS